jgi:hypothetical protein
MYCMTLRVKETNELLGIFGEIDDTESKDVCIDKAVEELLSDEYYTNLTFVSYKTGTILPRKELVVNAVHDATLNRIMIKTEDDTNLIFRFEKITFFFLIRDAHTEDVKHASIVGYKSINDASVALLETLKEHYHVIERKDSEISIDKLVMDKLTEIRPLHILAHDKKTGASVSLILNMLAL